MLLDKCHIVLELQLYEHHTFMTVSCRKRDQQNQHQKTRFCQSQFRKDTVY